MASSSRMWLALAVLLVLIRPHQAGSNICLVGVSPSIGPAALYVSGRYGDGAILQFNPYLKKSNSAPLRYVWVDKNYKNPRALQVGDAIVLSGDCNCKLFATKYHAFGDLCKCTMAPDFGTEQWSYGDLVKLAKLCPYSNVLKCNAGYFVKNGKCMKK